MADTRRPGRYVCLDAAILDDPRILALHSEGERVAYIAALTAAKRRHPPGGWPDRRSLAHDLGRVRRRHIDALCRAGLIVRDGPDDELIIADWDTWQRDPDPTHAKRQADYRARQAEPAAQPSENDLDLPF